MKKLTALLLTLSVSVVMMGCGNETSSTTKTSSSTTKTTESKK